MKRHYVSGFFSNREDAEATLSALIAKKFPPDRVNILESHSDISISKVEAKSNEVLKDILVDGAIGAGVGTGVGALVEVALVAANVTLFVASPLIAPLALLGWGASLGALAGTTIGFKVAANDKGGKFSDMIRDAISNNQIVLVAETTTIAETKLAQKVIKAAIGNYKDTNTESKALENQPHH
ncbi:hypothetical protein [Methylotenera sp.]|uniref:hypothetical protein n=1 Tax=Methylotenera sp. TaxID=2051956 RepID=UPI002734116E|nr:hypothetical protein [Methylotenera sp.]MDP3776303.1 hypothetical protein [Methylotenera sp.]